MIQQQQKTKTKSSMTAASATAAIVDVISETAEAKTPLPYTIIEKLEVLLVFYFVFYSLQTFSRLTGPFKTKF